MTRQRQGGIREVPPGSGHWELRVGAGKDPLTGRYRTLTRRYTGTKTGARRERAALVAQVAEGKHTGAQASVGLLLERWLDGVRADLSPSTVRGYEQWIKNRILPRFAETPLSKLRASDLDDFYAGLRNTGLAPATVRQVHAILHRALEQAVDWDWLPSNPASRTRPKKVPRYEITPPPPETIVRLMRAADATDPDLATFVRLAAATGARRGELTALRWRDVDLERGELRIAHAVIAHKGLSPLVKDTKTHAERRISLDPVTLAVLLLHRERWAVAHATATSGGELPPSAFLFSPEVDASAPWNPDHWTGAWARLRQTVGVREVRLHDLRHAHASELIGAGIDVVATSKRLGHSSPSVTLNIYSHALRANDQAAAVKIGELLAEREEAAPTPEG